MWQRLERQIIPFAATAWRLTVAFVRGPLKRALFVVLQTLAALVVLFLEWGWRPLADALARLSKYLVFARLEAWIATLPPYGALALFAAPAVCLFPLKLFALYLFATGHPVIAVCLIAGAKIVGTAFVARIFMLTQPQLMQISWFKRGYNFFMPWKEHMFAVIRSSPAWRMGRAVRVAVKRWANRLWTTLKPQRAWVAAKAGHIKTALQAWIQGLGRTQR